MDYVEGVEILRRRSLDFHRALKESGVYCGQVSEADFLERVESHLSQRARNVAQGIEGLRLTLLSLPVGLLYSLLDRVPAMAWDYEFGYEGFFEDLETLFDRTEHHFSWDYDAEVATLDYALNNQTWSMANVALDEEVEPISYLEIHRNLSQSLSARNQVLCEVVTGDQTGMLVLMTTEAAGTLADYLIFVDDPRAEWFYTGMPEADE